MGPATKRQAMWASAVVSLVSLAWVAVAAAPWAQGRRVVDIVTMGSDQSERDHDYAGERVAEGVINNRVFRQAAGWLRVSMKTYDDTEVTLEATFGGSAGRAIAFDLEVEGRRVAVPPFVSPSTLPAVVEYRVPMAVTRGKTRISVVIRAVGQPAPGLIELRTVQEHLEVGPPMALSRAGALR